MLGSKRWIPLSASPLCHLLKNIMPPIIYTKKIILTRFEQQKCTFYTWWKARGGCLSQRDPCHLFAPLQAPPCLPLPRPPMSALETKSMETSITGNFIDGNLYQWKVNKCRNGNYISGKLYQAHWVWQRFPSNFSLLFLT